MKAIEAELERIRADIQRLRIEEATIERLLRSLKGESVAAQAGPVKRRASNVKPLVLDIMAQAAATGATSLEVYERALAQNPSIGKDTISSVLSRLKSDGALRYDGERYFDSRYKPDEGKVLGVPVLN